VRIARGGRIDPGYARWLMDCRRIVALTAPPDAMARPPGPTPPCYLLLIIKPTPVIARQFDLLGFTPSAAAEFPPAERGLRSPDTYGDHQGSGLMLAFRP
jgi:hypothetical protein